MHDDEAEALINGDPSHWKATIAPNGLELGHEPPVTFPAADGVIIIPLQQLVRLEADGGYTRVFQTGGASQLVSRRLGDLHRHLPTRRFFRCHHGHVINLGFAVKLIRTGGHRVLLTTGDSNAVARRRWKELLSAIKQTH